LKQEVAKRRFFSGRKEQIVMNILSNFTPDCIVRAEVSCKIEDLKDDSGISNEEFAWKFKQAVTIAEIEPFRATTHNKGIMNGVDAVVIATGNDFSATEACALMRQEAENILL
jgi:hydroxymethylglutaryl-CoA reductase